MADPAVLVIPRVPDGGVHMVEAAAIIDVSPVADAVAVLLSVVQALMLPAGAVVVTVTADEAPGASVPGVQVNVPLVIEQVAPGL
jgi:hypothetical protein